MKLENRIQNIKKLLSYCPESTEDVMLSDDILCKFFWNFFSSKPERFKTPAFEGSTRVQITLLGMLDANYISHHDTILLRYCYEYDREGEDWTFYYFNDSECYFRPFDHPNLEYYEIPDNIWERIQNILYDKAVEEINKGLESAKSSVIYWEKRKEEFDNKLQLK
jgi:hypothetical protein